LYDTNDEPVKTLKRSIVPWGVMKKAMSLMEMFDVFEHADKPAADKTLWEKIRGWFRFSKTENETEASIRMLEEFIVEFFGNQCTAAELSGADTVALLAVLQSIMARANTAMPANPTTRRKRTRQ
jgi:hypothetical protein